MILLDPELDPDPAARTHANAPLDVRSMRTNRPDRIPSKQTLTRFLAEAQTATRLRGQVTVLLTTDSAVRRLNRQFRGKNKATDVLSFPAAEMPARQQVRVPATQRNCGDLAISVDTARAQAAEQGHALAAEIKVLMLHGLLHLAGYDHEADSGEMARREQALRARLRLPLGLIERANGRGGRCNSKAFTEQEGMSAAAILVIIVLAAIETLASYISRIYAEFGKILSREVQENLDVWEERIEPHLGLTRDHAAISALVAQQLALALMALEFGALLIARRGTVTPSAGEIVQALVGVVMVIVFCNQALPWLLFERTGGRWAVRLLWPIRLLLWSMTPITVLIRFFFSVASLAEEPATRQEEAAVDVEALLEAGEEEGILEETDRDLVRSAVEFGDKLVKEVMTPAPACLRGARTP